MHFPEVEISPYGRNDSHVRKRVGGITECGEATLRYPHPRSNTLQDLVISNVGRDLQRHLTMLNYNCFHLGG